MEKLEEIWGVIKILFSTPKQRQRDLENSKRFLNAIQNSDKLSLREVLEQRDKIEEEIDFRENSKNYFSKIYNFFRRKNIYEIINEQEKAIDKLAKKYGITPTIN